MYTGWSNHHLFAVYMFTEQSCAMSTPTLYKSFLEEAKPPRSQRSQPLFFRHTRLSSYTCTKDEYYTVQHFTVILYTVTNISSDTFALSSLMNNNVIAIHGSFTSLQHSSIAILYEEHHWACLLITFQSMTLVTFYTCRVHRNAKYIKYTDKRKTILAVGVYSLSH